MFLDGDSVLSLGRSTTNKNLHTGAKALRDQL